jgi:hypothetical protein
MRQAVEVPHAKGRGNQHSTYSAEASRRVRLSPTPIETASWKGAEGAKTRPRANQTRPPQDMRPKTSQMPPPPDAQATPRQRRRDGNGKKSQEIPYGGRLCAGERNARLSQPRAPSIGGEPRHCGRPRETGPEQPAEQNRRHGGRRRSRSKPPTSTIPRNRGRGYVRPRTSSSVTTSLLLSMSHILSSLAFWTAEGSATRV